MRGKYNKPDKPKVCFKLHLCGWQVKPSSSSQLVVFMVVIDTFNLYFLNHASMKPQWTQCFSVTIDGFYLECGVWTYLIPWYPEIVDQLAE